MRLVSDEEYMSSVESAIVNAFVDTNEALHQSEIDDTMSGTTGITILVRGKDIFVANVGDSRAFIAEVEPGGNRMLAEDLSHDQTPYRRDECDRVRRAGATVMTLDQLEGLKNPKVDCFTEEHEMLTSRGFLSLAALEALSSADPAAFEGLLFAGYDPEVRGTSSCCCCRFCFLGVRASCPACCLTPPSLRRATRWCTSVRGASSCTPLPSRPWWRSPLGQRRVAGAGPPPWIASGIF